MRLARSLTVNVLKPLFLNLLSNLSVIFGYCSQNLQPRVSSKLSSSLSILASVQALTFYYCVSSAVMLSIHYQNRPTTWATGGKLIKPCLYQSRNKRLMSLMKIFVAVLIKKGNARADAIVKSLSHIQRMSRCLIKKTLSIAKPMAVLKSIALSKQW